MPKDITVTLPDALVSALKDDLGITLAQIPPLLIDFLENQVVTPKLLTYSKSLVGRLDAEKTAEKDSEMSAEETRLRGLLQ